ncbi:MAG: hypothetical protein ACFCD0_09880 [Gemmataceae bacterium]
MLTIFSIPKPFRGHINVIQRNAIQSWKRVHPDVQVILAGDDEGVKEVAEEYGTEHINNVETTELGTPLLSSVFSKAVAQAKHRLVCYVNADIILFDDLLEAALRVEVPNFLMVGQRWDIDLDFAWNFDDPTWRSNLQQFIARKAKLHPPAGSDLFLFPPNGKLEVLPPFAVGRPAWDCWMIYNALKNQVPVIDATPSVQIVHQNHDYSHVPSGNGVNYYGPEAATNIKLAVGQQSGYHDLLDATYMLHLDGLRVPNTTVHRTRRRWRNPLIRNLYKTRHWVTTALRYLTIGLGVKVSRFVFPGKSSPTTSTP